MGNAALRAQDLRLVQNRRHVPVGHRRPDGTPNGVGYFGAIFEHDDPDFYATELPIVLIDRAGRMQCVPLIVPTSTYAELCHLVGGGRPTPMMITEAMTWAEGRRAHGQSPFANDQEQLPLPPRPGGRDDEEDA